MSKRELAWHKALEKGELEEGRVRSVTCGLKTFCMTHWQGKYAALDNRCPHQGGPLGEGSIEKGFLRCPWHGWDFDPITGRSPGGYEDGGVEVFAVEEREDGIYVGLEAEADAVDTVSDIMVRTMTNWGVRNVFGMVGHSNLGLAETIRREEEAGRLRYVGIRHEGAASFAASGYGKLTGRPAACLTIAGPGATNLLTGMWDAHVDRAPLLALTGQVDTQVLGPGAFQEVDLQAAFGKVAFWTQSVLHGSRHAELMNLACKHAIIQRGPTHLIFPDEVQTLAASAKAQPGKPQGRLTPHEISPPQQALEDALKLLKQSKRPVMIVGHGARFHMPEVLALAENMDWPVLTTFKGKGLIADDHPLGCGVLGRSGTPIASWFMNECDCLLVFGASFSNHTGISSYKPIIQVDFDPMMLGKFHAVQVPVWGEIGVTAKLLQQGMAGCKFAPQRQQVQERWRIWRQEKASRRRDDLGHGINSAVLFDALSRLTPQDAIMPVDVGNNTYSFGRYFECCGQAVLMSGYLGSIGFAYPAALGAWCATQEDDVRFKGRKVVSVSGDGGFGQYLAELTTAVKFNMNITHVLLHNKQLGKISKEQRAGQFPVWQTSLHNPDFSRYAELCGALGVRVSSAEMLDEALTRALAHPGPSLVEVLTDPELI